jgi:hypothetical protein
MKVIGAGLPRTGTLSQKVALEMLGLGPCYHMVNVLGDLDHVAVWERALSGEAELTDVLAGFEASVDWPAAFFYSELMTVFPDAKVVLSVRDPEAWVRSMRETIWGALYGDSILNDLSRARARVDARWRGYVELMGEMWQRAGLLGDGEAAAPGQLAEALERYNEAVTAAVDPGRLLVWSVEEGWEPLCRFLGVEVPRAPFPRLNDSSEFGGRVIDGALLALREWREGSSAQAPAPAQVTAAS